MDGFYRCGHCKGFYGIEQEECVYCGYVRPMAGVDGKPRIFPDRAICRSIQIAEWEQLPAKVRKDPMGPPPDEFEERCGCLHCGPDGQVFEAIEMRWIENEGMWACPCTTCGGRGYQFDIHPIENKWQCAECGHKWKPPGGNAKASNCKCPECGSTMANGWFDDEFSEEEIEAMTEEEYKEAFGKTRAEEEAEWRAFNEKWNREHPTPEQAEDSAPWNDAEVEMGEPAEEGAVEYDPEQSFEAELQEQRTTGRARNIPDDIDYPQDGIKEKDKPREEQADLDDDIPW